jgi:uncharacterized protein (DUF1499 family)
MNNSISSPFQRFSLLILGFVLVLGLLIGWIFLQSQSQSDTGESNGFFAGSAPENLGLTHQQLAPCPPTPNCVVSQNAQARERLLKVLSVVPRTSILVSNKDYIRAESRSRIFGFVDDLEFYLPLNQSQIEVRSSSRLGESDLGVNRRRLEQIRLAMQDLEP